MRMRHGWVIGALVVSLLAAPVRAEDDFAADLGWGSLAVLCNAFYMPAKLTYAILGGITGSLAYLLTVGDMDTAENIWQPSLGGTYVLTPAMLQDDQPIRFSPMADETPRRRQIEE